MSAPDIESLNCPNCGGPLPLHSTGVIRCDYCQSTLKVSSTDNHAVLGKRSVSDLYRSGLITRDEAIQRLLDMGYTNWDTRMIVALNDFAAGVKASSRR